MTYKAEDIKPKRYGEVEPSKSAHYWIITNDGYIESFGWVNNIDMWSWDKHVSWFIDIPGAPPELKPLKYPENKPDEWGYYMAHHKLSDDWFVAVWRGEELFSWRETVDWFIPYRLDREEHEMADSEQMTGEDKMGTEYWNSVVAGSYIGSKGKEDEMDVIWETGELKVFLCGNNRLTLEEISQNKDDYVIGCSKDELTAFARHWLDLQGYDVTKREPEIKGCPFCGSPVSFIPSERTSYHQLECMSCEYRSPSASTLPEAIRLHNLIAKGE